VIADKDPFLRHRFESLALRQFLDFHIFEWRFLDARFARDDRDLVRRKLAGASSRLSPPPAGDRNLPIASGSDRGEGLLGLQGKVDGNEPISGIQVVFAGLVKDTEVRQPVVAQWLHDAIDLADDEVDLVLAVVDAHGEVPRPSSSARHDRSSRFLLRLK
jgi:hypothetical protein